MGDNRNRRIHVFINTTLKPLDNLEKYLPKISRERYPGQKFTTNLLFLPSQPEKVTGLVIVEVSPASISPYFIDIYPEVLKAMKAVDFKHPKTIRKARNRAKEQLKAVIKDDNMMSAVISNINLKDDNTIGWTCNLDVLIKHFKYMASFPQGLKGKRYRGPTLFIGGQYSDAIPPDDLTKMRMFFPQAIVHYVRRAGHYLHFDDPKSFMELVMNFVRETQTA